MTKTGCLMMLLVVFFGLLYFGFFYEPKPYYPSGPEETWKSYPVLQWTLEDGWTRTGTYSESNYGRRRYKGE